MPPSQGASNYVLTLPLLWSYRSGTELRVRLQYIFDNWVIEQRAAGDRRIFTFYDYEIVSGSYIDIVRINIIIDEV